MQAKSTTYGGIGNWRRNRNPSCRFRSSRQSARSVSVMSFRSPRARAVIGRPPRRSVRRAKTPTLTLPRLRGRGCRLRDRRANPLPRKRGMGQRLRVRSKNPLPRERGMGRRSRGRSKNPLPRKRGRVGVGVVYEPVFDILCDRCGLALLGVTPAAAAAGFEDEAVAGADRDAGFLGPDRARLLVAGMEQIAVRQPVFAAEDAA